jgi:hypothetical protein
MHPTLKELKVRLLRRGLAPRHVARYLEELEDHLKDLTSAAEATGLTLDQSKQLALSKIGSVDALESGAIQRRELYAWSHRMPWVPFLVLPAVAVPSLSIGLFFTLGVAYSTRLVGADDAHLHWFEFAWFLLSAFIFYGVPLLAGAAMTFVAVRQRMSWKWPILGPLAGYILFPTLPFALFFRTPSDPQLDLSTLNVLGEQMACMIAPYAFWKVLKYVRGRHTRDALKIS